MVLLLLSVSCSPALNKTARARALSPIASLTVNGSERQTAAVTIPSDQEWRKIIAYFGQPTYDIAPVNTKTGWQRCPDTGTELLVQDATGHRVPLFATSPLYGWSSECKSGSYKGSFRAQPGDKVLITIVVSKGAKPKEHIVAVNWKNMKDKLVGLEIRDNLASKRR